MAAQRTPLFDAHRAAGARLIEFGGWEMPLSYRGGTEEHHAVRRACGVFDVSHMGEIVLRGDRALAAAQSLTVNDVGRLRDGDAQYTVMCDERGGVLDDLIVYRRAADDVLLVVNAATTAGDLAWVRERVGSGVRVDDESAATVLVAAQGPLASSVVARLGGCVADQPPFTLRQMTLAGAAVAVSRTGYTGEDGFEILMGARAARRVWDALLEEAAAVGGGAAGLAARDTLRLEAGLPLYGTDMDATTTPLEAGLAWVVKLDREDFIGRAALRRQAAAGPPRRLVGLVLDGATGIPRHGFAVWHGDHRVGEVTSGTRAPTLGLVVAMAYVASAVAADGTAIAVEIRGRRVAGRIVRRPFYRRPARKG